VRSTQLEIYIVVESAFSVDHEDDLIDVIVQDDYDAVLENPTCEIYKDLFNRFDDAKVILTVRDSPEKFEQSWKTLMDTFVVTEQTFSWRFPSFFWLDSYFSTIEKDSLFHGNYAT